MTSAKALQEWVRDLNTALTRVILAEMRAECDHRWQPPESTVHITHGYHPSGSRYRPEDINMRVCASCGEVGWLVPSDETEGATP